MLFAILAVLLVILILSVVLRVLVVPKPLPGIPYNTLALWQPWGDFQDVGMHNTLTGEVFDWLSLQCVKHCSPVVQVFIPSFSIKKPVVIVADIKEIESITTRRLREIDRASMMRDFFNVIPKATIGMRTDSVFRQQRRLWNSILSPRFLTEVAAPHFHAVMCQLVQLWDVKRGLAPGLAFEAAEDVRQTTLDAMGAMAMGMNLGLLDAQIRGLQTFTRSGKPAHKNKKGAVASFGRVTYPPSYRAFRTILASQDWIMQGVSPRLNIWISNYTPAYTKARSVLSKHLTNAISQARQRQQQLNDTPSSKSHCGLDQVLHQEHLKEAPPGHTDEALHDELLELLITGHETTASSIGWALKYLADNQEAQTRLRAALRRAFPGCSMENLPSAKDITTTQLPYLEATIAEVLRISRSGPISFREAVMDTEILGHRVPAGTPILLVTAGPSYESPEIREVAEKARVRSGRKTIFQLEDERKWEWDPAMPQNVFSPERWLDEDGEFDPEAGPSLPFSAGPRGCFGKKIALLELRIILAVLVVSFRFPKLEERLSRYASFDGLTRKPTCCYVMPEFLS
ncbi:cytochrome P450 [Pseudomassariella vexata]|uniref:Cytochrome P450 n=1 Tax=Pseudomassariella vexata TaxID=1141098 RepID=A0A1Y2EIU3_9PEZI|nr:cytochrome P450 [Pseudomassariella vexata]ORY71146.1 cytochrome P450 [Pseudomassariella vexata]